MEKERKSPIILFAIGVLLSLLLLVEGESFWLWMHTHLLGWFGVGIPVILIMCFYSGVRMAKRKPGNGILLCLIFAFFQVFVFLIGADSSTTISEEFAAGTMFAGSGGFGWLLGMPFLLTLGTVGGLLVSGLCLAVSVLLLTNISFEKPPKQSNRKPVRETRRVPAVTVPEYVPEPSYNTNETPRNPIAAKLVDALLSFGVQATVTNIIDGPSVTRYEVQPAKGVRINSIASLSDDIALALGVPAVRVEPVPGKTAVGIEVPSAVRGTVRLRDMIESAAFRKTADNKLTFCLGQDIGGRAVLPDLSEMPHLLIGGTTGSGKSVCVNTLILSMLCKADPSEVKFIMIDPKRVELTAFEGIPHLLTPVVTDPVAAAGALRWAVNEMDKRYQLLSEQGARDINGYNRRIRGSSNLPNIVIIIDEFADLIQTAPKDVETAVCRLAQKARAAGIHMVIATQRPTTNVITGNIKANIPSRIALHVSSQNDSRTILDNGGAEKLLGNGDMLFAPAGCQKPVRLQGCYASDTELDRVIRYVRKNWKGECDQKITEEIRSLSKPETLSRQEIREDPLLEDAVRIVTDEGQASTALLQRKLRVGYARAGSLIDALAEAGVVGGFAGSKPRTVLINYEQWSEQC